MNGELSAPCLVQTRYGAVRGVASGAANRFLGIPYAAPPVGERRFALPQLPKPWPDVRDATRAGPNAPQIIRAFPGLDVTPLVGRGWQRGDDFLTLNIWTPSDGRGKCPVLIFIHGGAFIGGCSDAGVHDGTEFARDGIVYAAINYRLGVEGFLPMAGAPTNLGLRDQIAAIEWVRANIDAFGGNPGNITVAGESAGAMSIANLLASPLAHGLIRRAIVQSGHGSMVRPLEVAERVTRVVARHLNVAPDAAGFKQRSFEECTAAVDAISRPDAGIDLKDRLGRDPAYGLTRFLPVYGDDVLPRFPLDAFTGGERSKTQLLIGTNRDEMNLYFVPAGVKARITAASAEKLLGSAHPQARDMLAAYGLGQREIKPGVALTEAMNDLVFRLPARRFAEAFPGTSHLYEFGWPSTACGGELGACHGLELPFVFDTLATCTGPAGIAGTEPPQALARDVHHIWVEFVTDGKLPWARYQSSTRQRFSLETRTAGRDADMPASAF